MQPLKLTYELIEETPNQFVGWLNEIDGVIAQGESEQEVREELLKMLRIKWDVERKHKVAKSSNCQSKTEELRLQVA